MKTQKLCGKHYEAKSISNCDLHVGMYDVNLENPFRVTPFADNQHNALRNFDVPKVVALLGVLAMGVPEPLTAAGLALAHEDVVRVQHLPHSAQRHGRHLLVAEQRAHLCLV